jgi:hypothetical protein
LLNYELNLTATLFVFGQRKVGKLQSEFPQPDQLPLMCRLHYYWKRKFGMHQNRKIIYFPLADISTRPS